MHLLVVWYLVNLQDARCNNKDNSWDVYFTNKKHNILINTKSAIQSQSEVSKKKKQLQAAIFRELPCQCIKYFAWKFKHKLVISKKKSGSFFSYVFYFLTPKYTPYYCRNQGCTGIFTRIWTGKLENCSPIRCTDKIFYLYWIAHPDWLWAPPSLLFIGHCGLFPRE